MTKHMLFKGVESVLTGELWYSRKAVSRYLKQTASRSLVQPNENTTPAPREKVLPVEDELVGR